MEMNWDKIRKIGGHKFAQQLWLTDYGNIPVIGYIINHIIDA